MRLVEVPAIRIAKVVFLCAGTDRDGFVGD
jgi:hypothetical protein